MEEWLNQTQFAEEQPFLGSDQRPPVPVEESNTPKAKWTPQKIAVVIGIGVGVLMLVLLIAAIMMRTPVIDQVEPEPSLAPLSNPALGPLETRILDVGAELEAADPTKMDFPFPPLDSKLRLDDKNNI